MDFAIKCAKAGKKVLGTAYIFPGIFGNDKSTWTGSLFSD